MNMHIHYSTYTFAYVYVCMCIDKYMKDICIYREIHILGFLLTSTAWGILPGSIVWLPTLSCQAEVARLAAFKQSKGPSI